MKGRTDMELLEEILNPNNLNKAYKKVVSNKGVAGVDGITVEEEFDYLKENKDRILNQIRKRRYKPQPVKRVQIPKENGKMRNLGIPTVTDRIIQQAIVQIISPIFEKQFNADYCMEALQDIERIYNIPVVFSGNISDYSIYSINGIDNGYIDKTSKIL